MRGCRYKEKVMSNTQGTRVISITTKFFSLALLVDAFLALVLPAEKRALFSASKTDPKQKPEKASASQPVGATVVLEGLLYSARDALGEGKQRKLPF